MSFILNPYIFKKKEPNLFIGGVGTTITTKSALAAKFTDVSTSDIKNFKVIGSDVYAYIEKNITLETEAFYLDSDITYFIHNSEEYSCSSPSGGNTENRSFSGSTIEFLYIKNCIRLASNIISGTTYLQAFHIDSSFVRATTYAGSQVMPFSINNSNLQYFNIEKGIDIGIALRYTRCVRVYLSNSSDSFSSLRQAANGAMGNTFRQLGAIIGNVASILYNSYVKYYEVDDIGEGDQHEATNVAQNNSLIFRINNATSIPYRAIPRTIFSFNRLREIHIPKITSIGNSHSVVFSIRGSTNSNLKIYVHPSMMTANAGNMDATLQDWQDNGLATIIPVTNQDPPNPPTALYHDNYNSGTGEVEIHFTNPTAGTNAIEYYEVWACWIDEPIPLDFPEVWPGVTTYPDYWYFVQTIPASSSVVSSFTNDKNYKIKLRTKDILGNLSAFSDDINLITH